MAHMEQYITGPGGKRDDDAMANYSDRYCSATKGGQCSYKGNSRTCTRCHETKGPPQVQQCEQYITGPGGRRDDDAMANYSDRYCSATMGGQCSYKGNSRTCTLCHETK